MTTSSIEAYIDNICVCIEEEPLELGSAYIRLQDGGKVEIKAENQELIEQCYKDLIGGLVKAATHLMVVSGLVGCIAGSTLGVYVGYKYAQHKITQKEQRVEERVYIAPFTSDPFSVDSFTFDPFSVDSFTSGSSEAGIAYSPHDVQKGDTATDIAQQFSWDAKNSGKCYLPTNANDVLREDGKPVGDYIRIGETVYVQAKKCEE